MFTKFYIQAKVANKTWTNLKNCLISNTLATSATVTIDCASDQTGKLYIGTSKTLMLTSFDGTFNTNKYTFSLTGLTAGTTYYFYIINTKAGEGARTGIYTFTTASA